MPHLPLLLRILAAWVVLHAVASGQCTRLPDGTWQCPPAAPAAQPTAMDIRVECPTSRGSGTAVARTTRGDTLIVTNHHVVQGQPTITLHSGDSRGGEGRTAEGELVATDRANDLALVTVRAKWPHVKLGGEVAIGTPVQFRAFDSGVRFRKYFGNIVRDYQAADGAGGYFATGASRPGNSGGGVYSRGRLVGVVWGNPDGGTALIPIGPVRRLIERVLRQQRAKPIAPQVVPEATPALPIQPSSAGEGCEGGCGCDQRWREVESRLAQLYDKRDSTPLPHEPFNWVPLVTTALGVSGPIGVAIVAAGALVRVRRRQDSERGPGGPRDETFHSFREDTKR